jgi:tRNA U34 2-thiouridine synthase MnmA/TrmU
MKAIALLSGGLDSILAAKVIQQQGIEVIGAHFKTAFGHDNKKNALPCVPAEKAGIPFQEADISADFLTMLRHPHHGYGSHLNPCIDCKILMLKKSKEMMQGLGASFVITGEVLGQRPMSQHRRALAMIEKESGLEGILLRPLSAKLLLPTLPEQEGWVDRERLFGLSGRTRRPQMNLAKMLGITDYSNPAGGCLLTDPEFAKRLKDLMTHGTLDVNNVGLLKIGRHFRFSPAAKLVVGRNEKENTRLLEFAKVGDYLFMPKDIAGPTALGRGSFDDKLIRDSCGIVCRYSDLEPGASADILYRAFPSQEEKILTIPKSA